MIQQNFIQLYEKSFKQNWDLPALSDYNGITYTYGEVAKQVARPGSAKGWCCRHDLIMVSRTFPCILLKQQGASGNHCN